MKRIKYILLLSIMTIMSIFNGIDVYAAQGLYSSELGTNAALGSPLLNENFQVEDWNAHEMITFGIFLSNFCVNWGEDNYETAFSTNSSEGLKGKAYASLVFGTGSDSVAMRALQSMLSYAIDVQKKDRRQLYVKYKYSTKPVTEKGQSGMLSDDYAEAKGTDLMMYSNKGPKWSEYYEILGVDSNSLGLLSSSLDSLKSKHNIVANKAGVPIEGRSYLYSDIDVDVMLYVKGAGGSYQLVFDSSDGWDLEQYAGYVTQGWVTGVMRDNTEWFKSIANSKLYLDCFGNIVADSNIAQSVILFPASCNQYLTQSKSYNYLTIATINDSYTRDVGGFNYGDGSNEPQSNSNGSDSVAGTRIVGFDTNSAIGSYINQNEASRAGLDGDAGEEHLNMQWGQVIVNLLQSDLNSQNASTMPPITFIINGDTTEGVSGLWGLFGHGKKTAVSAFWANSIDVANLRNFLHPPANTPKRLTKLYTPKGDINIFGQALYVPTISNNSVKSMEEDIKSTIVILKYLDGNMGISHSADAPELEEAPVIRQKLLACSSMQDVAKLIFFSPDNSASPLLRNARELLGQGEGSKDWAEPLNMDRAIQLISRIAKFYPRNTMLDNVLDVFTAKEGAEFDYLTPYVYMTYLQWYGVVGTDGEDLNDGIFLESMDVLQVDPETLFANTFMSEEEKKSSVLDYTYLLLNPDSDQGTAYKNKLLRRTFAETLYSEYKSLSSANSDDSGSVRQSGFLSIPSLSENFLTSWFIHGYIKIIIGVIGVLVTLIIVLAVIRRKKLSWIVLSVVLTVSVCLLLPSMAEVTPFIGSQIVQVAFSKNLSYWTLSESASNLVAENQRKKSSMSASSTDQEELMKMLDLSNRISTVVTDSALMLKNDISKKINADINDISTDIQSLQSTRWLMPILMQEYTSDDGSMDYLYTSLNSMYVDEQNLYWYYNPSSKLVSRAYNSTENSITAQSSTEYGKETADILNNQRTAYSKYKDIDSENGAEGSAKNVPSENTFLSLTRALSDENLTHAGYYLVDFTHLNGSVLGIDMDSVESGGLSDATRSGLRNAEKKMEELASTYDATAGTPQCFGYLLTSINPGYYFYMLVRDTCNGLVLQSDQALRDFNQTTDISPTGLSSLVHNLQGEVLEYVDTSPEQDGSGLTLIEDLPEDYEYTERDIIRKRESFMHANGYIRDFLDMEELFTNVIPYMYDMYHIAEGDTIGEDGQKYVTIGDGDSAIKILALFQPDELMEDYALYKENKKSWFWRCNWAIKLVESKNFNRETRVKGRNAEGKATTYDLKGPALDPRSYPSERPMVFSEAQMHYQNLTESDLTLPELKILKVNEAVEKKWTYLLNYANLNDISEEVFYRQMALDALLAFNQEFTTSRLFNASRALYPTTVDLRNLSFDSVLRILVLGSTRNTSYALGDVMTNIIRNGSAVTTYVLIAAAYMCNIVTPFVRSIFMGMLFYLLLWVLVTNIFSAFSTKRNIVVGYLIANGLFALINILYFGVFNLLIQITSIDSVLTTETVNAAPSSPAVVFIIILLASLLNCAATIWLLVVVFINRKDMGFAKFMFIGQRITSKLSGAFNKVLDRFSGRGLQDKSGDHTASKSSGDSSNSGGSNSNNSTSNNKDEQNSGTSSGDSIEIAPAEDTDNQPIDEATDESYNDNASDLLLNDTEDAEKTEAQTNAYNEQVSEGKKQKQKEQSDTQQNNTKSGNKSGKTKATDTSNVPSYADTVHTSDTTD